MKFLKITLLTVFLFQSINADSLKNELIIRISNFVNWNNYNDDFNICIFNSYDTSDVLRNKVRNKKIHDLNILIHDIHSYKDIRNNHCEVIYFKEEINSKISEILEFIKHRDIFTITDIKNDVYDYIQYGLYYENNKIKFIMNSSLIKNLKLNYRIKKITQDVGRS